MPNTPDTHPPWLVLPARNLAPLADMERLLRDRNLHTVCESANCPNQVDCFARRTCTFMILGDRCTRNCMFCAVKHGHPQPIDTSEPGRVADAARTLDLRYAVVTSVTRDDLRDGGAMHYCLTVCELRKVRDLRIEVLVPDFGGDSDALEQVVGAEPDVISHNIETVQRLYARVRPGAAYERSLAVIEGVSRSACASKSGLMLGLGETHDEVIETMGDLRLAGCESLTIGQYLRPDGRCLPVERYVEPGVFDVLQKRAIELGFRACIAGPLVRSSYHAEDAFEMSERARGS